MATLTGEPNRWLFRLGRLRRELFRHGLARHGAAGLAAAATAATGQFAIVLVVTRTLEPRAAGAFFTATTACLMLAGVVRLDTGNGLVHALAGSRTLPTLNAGSPGPEQRVLAGAPRQRTPHPTASPGSARGVSAGAPHRRMPPAASAGLLRGVLAPVAALACVAAAGVWLAAGPLAGLTGVSPGVWAVLAAALPFVVLSDVLVCATRGLGTMRPTLLISGVVQPIGQLALVTAAVLAGAPPTALAAAWALPSVACAALAAVRLRGLGPYDVGDVRAFWRHTAPRSAAAAVQSVFQRLDVVVVALLAGPAAAAVYTAATRFKVVGQLAGQGLAQAAQARLVMALAEGDLGTAGRVYRTTTRWLVGLTWPLWLGYAALAPWALSLFGPAYAGGVAIALVLSATMMVATACGMVDVVLVAGGRTAASLANVTTAVAVTIALDVLLVPSHGALGAALGWSGGVLVKNLLPAVQVSRRYGLRPFGVGRLTERPLAAGCLAGNTRGAGRAAS
ncbi:lipopolysaccharide biosynthesis protein [Microbispora triticiradicis]|uniref:lipopolysaccharide biosynthesis protein n=1 Tax=Microbispora TaxID=2005 RepID=UPI00165278DD|nr:MULTISPECIES: polysaccharide biosynthesis C-terminal domain-containing protein [Microbispora]